MTQRDTSAFSALNIRGHFRCSNRSNACRQYWHIT